MDFPVLDKCPGYNLYIGGFIALRRHKALRNCNITHIVSVIDWKFDTDSSLVKGFEHLHIPVDDVDDENLLEWFPRSNAFIHAALGAIQTKRTDLSQDFTQTPEDGGVLIHCAMGKSRSATVLIAYLLWSSRQKQSTNTTSTPDSEMISLPSPPLSVTDALMLLRRGRPIAEPNEGFMDQLHMFEAMGCPTTEADIKRHKIYRRWMNRRAMDEALRINQAPEMAMIKFEDEHEDGPDIDTEPNAINPISEQTQTGGRSNTSGLSSGKQSPQPGSLQAPEGSRTGTSISSTTTSTDRSTSLKREKERHMGSLPGGVHAPDGHLISSASASNPATTRTSPTPDQPSITLKCRKCRHTVATTPFIVSHSPPNHPDPSVAPDTACAHIFLHPLSWMRPALAEGKMEGRLACPNAKCGTNIGKFAWTGLRCSCGGWVTPGFGITRGRVDEIMDRSISNPANRNVKAGVTGGGSPAAVRFPPGMKGRGNL